MYHGSSSFVLLFKWHTASQLSLMCLVSDRDAKTQLLRLSFSSSSTSATRTIQLTGGVEALLTARTWSSSTPKSILYGRLSFLGAWILCNHWSTAFRTFTRGKNHRSNRPKSLPLSRFQQRWISNIRWNAYWICHLNLVVYVHSGEYFRFTQRLSTIISLSHL